MFLAKYILDAIIFLNNENDRVEGFQLRWLKTKGNDAAFPISITLSFNHLKGYHSYFL